MNSTRKSIRSITILAMFSVAFFIAGQGAAEDMSPGQWADHMMGEMELLRGLDYTSKVPVTVMGKADTADTALSLEKASGDATYSTSKLETILRALSLLDETTSFSGELYGVHEWQRRSWYDTARNEIFFTSDMNTPRWSSPLIKRTMQQIEMEEVQFAISREMAYALIAQNFDSAENAPASTDSFMASRAVTDGGMVLLACEYLLRNTGLNILMLPDPEAIIQQFLPLVTYVPTEVMEELPRPVESYVSFPYLKGLSFAFHQEKSGGTLLLDAAYRSRPISTEQILHPEKYFEKRDNPIIIQLPPLGEELGGATLLAEDTLGEWGLRLLLENWMPGDSEAASAADGWGGDRVAVYDLAEGGDAVAWFTTWDDAEEADIFESTLTRAARTGLPEGRVLRAERIGRDVAFTVGVPESASSAVMSMLWQSAHVPVVMPPPIPEKPDPESVNADVRAFLNIFMEKSSVRPQAGKSWQEEGDVFRNLEYRYEVTRPNGDWHFEKVQLGGLFLSEFTALNLKEPGSSFTVYTFDKYGPDDPYNPVDEMVHFMGRQMQGYKKIDEQQLTVAGMPARAVTFSGIVFMPLTITYTEIFGEERCYIMTYWSLKTSHKKLLPQFEAFRDSFKVIETE